MKKIVEYYEKNKKGKLLSCGSEHIVYNYDIDKVIKFSIIHFFYGKQRGYPWACEELNLTKKYFGKYVLDTKIVRSKDQKYHAQLQPKIVGHPLVPQDLDNKILYNQFREIINCYNNMCKNSCPELDLIGQSGVFTNCISNIFVVEQKKLVIIDSTLFNTKAPYPIRLLLLFLRKIVLPIQNRKIQEFLNLHNKK